VQRTGLCDRLSPKRMPRLCGALPQKGEWKMPGTRSLTTVTLIATALAGALVVATSQPAQAQRKSIRWAVASVDTYGYKVAASVTKIIEEALGGEYTVTVNPYPSTTAAMKATMEGDGEIGYTADVGMTEYVAGEGAFRTYKQT